MPRAFLIKKHSPAREVMGGKQRIELENEHASKSYSSSAYLDQSSVEPRGPFDLSTKSKNLDVFVEDTMNHQLLHIKSPPSAIEFSPKIVSSSNIDALTIGVTLIEQRTPSPNHSTLKQGAPLEPLNPNTPPNTRTSPWHRPFMTPTYPPFNFPLYPLPRHASDFYSGPASYLGSSLISPPLLPLSPPRSTLGVNLEPLSPCIPRENVSPSSSFYGNPGLSDHLHIEHPVACKDLPVYHSPWIYKEGSTSPIPRSDSSDSGGDSAGNNSKNGTTVSNSTRNGGHPGNHAPRYHCVDCNKSYSTYSGLSRHRQFHCITQAKKSFNCKYCEKVYVSLGALKMHIRTHTLPCKCKLCGKAFSRPWLLQGHIRTHTGEKPFACPHCSRAFADRSNLRAHLQTHSDVKKYSCKTCSKTFSRMSLLLKHGDGSCVGSQSR